jgi:HEPN domain-containing protein
VTRKFKVAHTHPNVAANYLRKALEFRHAMNTALAEREGNAAALNAVHCAISAADALCVHVGGKRSSSKNHADAVRLLAELVPGEVGRRQGDRLAAVLAKKNQVEYEERLFSVDEALNLSKQAERLFDWVRGLIGPL